MYSKVYTTNIVSTINILGTEIIIQINYLVIETHSTQNNSKGKVQFHYFRNF